MDLSIVGHVEKYSNGEFILRWSPGSETDPVMIERSEAPHEGFEVLAENIDPRTGVWIDTTASSLPPNENRTFYYRVGGALLHLGEVPGPIAREIIARDQWFLKSSERHSGSQEVEIFIRKTLAERCKVCWDPIQQKVTRSKCKSCLGTGMENPYFSSLKIMVSNYIPANIRRPQEDRIAQWNDTQLWTSNMPILKPGDLMIYFSEPWRVESVQFTRQNKSITKQIISIKRFDVNRDEYGFPFVSKFKNSASALFLTATLEVDGEVS